MVLSALQGQGLWFQMPEILGFGALVPCLVWRAAADLSPVSGSNLPQAGFCSLAAA